MSCNAVKVFGLPPTSANVSPPWAAESLQGAAGLLGVPAEELQACLAVRTLVAGKQSILKPCSLSDCGVRRDCLAKVVYAQ